MKNAKSALLLFSALIFLLISMAAGAWFFTDFFDETEPVKTETLITLQPVGNDSLKKPAITKNTRDSLKKVYTASLKTLQTNYPQKKDADGKADKKLEEFNKLKTDISKILKEKQSDAGLELARQKISELQKKINELTGKNNEIEKENRELYSLLRNYSQDHNGRNTGQNIKTVPVVFDNRAAGNENQMANKSEPAQSSLAPDMNGIFQTSNLKLSAYSILDNREQETYQALQADKFVASFMVKNLSARYSVGEVFLVLMQPDGHVLQKSAWESGTFESGEGKKVYSCKTRYDYRSGEEKQVSFTLDAGKCQKGDYRMMIYSRGKNIGELTKKLF